MGLMVTDEQVRLLRKKLMKGQTQEAAAAAAGMSVRTARRWQQGPIPSESRKPRDWRTRPDPFAAVWESEVVPMLQADEKGALQATTILDHLNTSHPGEFGQAQLRTLQRRIRDWRALHGPDKEVFFEQEHPPGREAQIDFTHGTELGVKIGGIVFTHLLFQFILCFSGWRYVGVALGETFEALSEGLQDALWALGGAPAVARTDNLSAATHELKASRGRTLTTRFKAVLEHYNLESTRIRAGRSNENGVVEQGHFRLKTAIEQALVLRGSRDFVNRAEYESFVANVVASLNARVEERFAAEKPHLQPLPPAPIPAYSNEETRVRKWSTIRVRNRTYSVPSRLIGHRVRLRVYPDTIAVYYGDKHVETMERLRGERTARIDYRHVIWSLVRTPGAFARYRYREELFPTVVFRRAYDALCEARGERADVEYVRILHLAASTMEADVERALAALLQEQAPLDYARVKKLAAPEPSVVPELSVPREPDLSIYDQLIGGGAQ